MKLLPVLLLVLFVAIAAPVYAYAPPSQGTDNATDIIIWYGDNLTIESITGTITIEDLQEALVAAGEAQAEVISQSNEDVFADAILLAIVVLLVALVFWQRTIFLYAVGSPVAITYGLSRAVASTDNAGWVAGVAIALIGTWFLYQIVLQAFDWAKKRGKE